MFQQEQFLKSPKFQPRRDSSIALDSRNVRERLLADTYRTLCQGILVGHFPEACLNFGQHNMGTITIQDHSGPISGVKENISGSELGF